MGLEPIFCGWNSGEAMKAPDKLTRLIEPVVIGMGYELVGVEFDSRQRILRVYIDSEAGILIDDCSQVSHQLSGMLDVEDPIPGEYQLEVSSPGMDRPLFTLAQFERFKGSLARVQLHRPLEGRRKFKALIVGVEGDTLQLQEGEAVFAIPFDSIDKARLVPEFEH